MCWCNPSIRTICCGGDDCYPILKKYWINKAIEEADLLFVDDVLVKPYTLEGKKLGYNDLSTGEDCFCNIDNVEIKGYEEKVYE